MLETQDPAKVFEYLQEVFTKNPEKLMSAAQRIAKKLQTKFLRGEIKREEIITEIEELMKEFSGNEAFNAIFGNLGELLSSSAKATGNEGSERRRVVQERLRKKAAEKEAKKSLALPDAAAVAAAEAAAAALLAEDAKKKSKK
jgi:aminopeptidase N